MLLGGIEFAKFEGLTSMPQKAASAWSAVEGLIGANYEPVLFVGTQLVKGVNIHFIAKQTLTTAEPETHLVKIAVNDFNGVYSIVLIERIY